MNKMDVDEMMEQIRSELLQVRPQPPLVAGARPSIDEVLMRARAELANRRRHDSLEGLLADADAGGAAKEGPWHPAAERLPGQTEYVLGDLLKYGDADFVEVAYRILLRRPPDPVGFDHYVTALRGGDLTKVEILGQIRWSEEGEARGVHVDGLLVPYTLQRWRRKRYVGPVVSWIHSFARLGTLVDRQAVHDAALAREAQEVGRVLNHVAVQLQDRISGLDEKLETYADRKTQAKLEQAVSRVQSDASLLQAASSAHEAGLASVDARLGEHSATLERLQAALAVLQEGAASREARVGSLEAAQAAHEVTAARLDGLEHKLQITASIAEGIVLREEQAKDGAKALDQFYADFEDEFRGDRQLVSERSEPYLQWVRDARAGGADAPVLDVGCGRGEWLELLRHNGLHARGIDLNRVFVDACRAMGLAVTEQDAIQGMKSLPAASLGAVTSMHLVEHLPFETMIALIDEARRVLRPGGLLALETPNPENLTVASHTFYYDPTHRNPLPPVVLRWIVESRGFEDVRIERLTHARDIQAPDPLPDELPGATSMNVLIRSLGVAPDYAIVARRP